MDDLVQTALIGTGRHPRVPVAGLEALAGDLADRSAERRLLLLAGARACARAAGWDAPRLPAPPAAAEPDARPLPPEGAVPLLGEAFVRYPSVLPEALHRLDAAGWRLPPVLLPAALDSRREEVLAVLDARGRWLAGQREAWAWAGPGDAAGGSEGANAPADEPAGDGAPAGGPDPGAPELPAPGADPWALDDWSPQELTRAVLRRRATAWMPALYDAWLERGGPVAEEIGLALVASMPAAEAEPRVAARLEAGQGSPLGDLVQALPTPWSEAFSRRFLGALQRHLRSLGPRAEGDVPAWPKAVRQAGPALSAAVLDEVEAFLPGLPRSRSARIGRWRSALDRLRDVVGFRRRLLAVLDAHPGEG